MAYSQSSISESEEDEAFFLKKNGEGVIPTKTPEKESLVFPTYRGENIRNQIVVKEPYFCICFGRERDIPRMVLFL